MTTGTKAECFQIDRFKRIEADHEKLYGEIHGNGRVGLREELVELRISVKAIARGVWIVIGVVAVNLAGALFQALK